MSTDPRDAGDAPRRVADLADGLAAYHRRYEAERDSRAVFAYTYFNMTHDLAERLARDDAGFDDPGWIADLAEAFATRYMAAMDGLDEWQREHGPDPAVTDSLYRTVPRPWADVYRAICRRRSTVLEDLVVAMAAHITYDLPHALLEVDAETDNLGDYHRMNDVLASGTDAVQDAVTTRYNRVLARLDRIVGGADELFTDYWIRIGRSVAWYNAMRLRSPRSRPDAEGSIERATFHLVRSIRGGGPLRWGVRLYRELFPLTRRWPHPPDGSAEGTEVWESRW